MSDEIFLTREEQAQLREAFYAQAKEMLQDFAERVLELEQAEERPEVLRALERTVHTVKGDSMALEFTDLAKISHRIEDYLRGLRRMDHLRRKDIDLLLACGDRMSELLEVYCEKTQGALPDIEALCERLVPPSGDTDTREMSIAGMLFRLTISFARECQMHSAGAFLIQRRLEKLGRVVGVDPDPDTEAIEKSRRWIVRIVSEAAPKHLRKAARVPGVTSRVVLKEESADALASIALGDEAEEALDAVDVRGEATRTSGMSTAVSSELLRVEVTKIDRIMNLVGELVIGRSMVAQALSEMEDGRTEGGVRDRLTDANGFLERTLTELQAAVLKIRMVPVEHVFRRIPRLVRDLAHSSKKKVELEIQGGLTELDKSIVDALGEPLLHLVRNAIDHGIEAPEDRERAGKPAAGRLILSAYYEGNHAHVVVEDDGRGVDVARVAERATRSGLFEPGQLDQMAPADILNAIYQPGFSTKDDVSDVSGRGIGMDVVRESIEKLKGVIELETAPGRGTRFLIRLPLTLAILRAVLVESVDRAFAVPLTGVLEIVRLATEQERSVLGRGVLHWREQVVPLVSLREVLGLRPEEGNTTTREEGAFVLLVGEAEHRVGLVADRLLGEQELVVKPIEDGLSKSPGVAGASILGNGRVVLILHTRGLLDNNVSLARKVEVLR